MEPQTSSSTITIDASAAEVWTVLADEFVDIAAWSPGVKSSGPNPATPEGINGSRYGRRVAEIEGMLAAGTGASTHLKTYIESDTLQGGANRG